MVVDRKKNGPIGAVMLGGHAASVTVVDAESSVPLLHRRRDLAFSSHTTSPVGVHLGDWAVVVGS